MLAKFSEPLDAPPAPRPAALTSRGTIRPCVAASRLDEARCSKGLRRGGTGGITHWWSAGSEFVHDVGAVHEKASRILVRLPEGRDHGCPCVGVGAGPPKCGLHG